MELAFERSMKSSRTQGNFSWLVHHVSEILSASVCARVRICSHYAYITCAKPGERSCRGRRGVDSRLGVIPRSSCLRNNEPRQERTDLEREEREGGTAFGTDGHDPPLSLSLSCFLSCSLSLRQSYENGHEHRVASWHAPRKPRTMERLLHVTG